MRYHTLFIEVVAHMDGWLSTQPRTLQVLQNFSKHALVANCRKASVMRLRNQSSKVYCLVSEMSRRFNLEQERSQQSYLERDIFRALFSLDFRQHKEELAGVS